MIFTNPCKIFPAFILYVSPSTLAFKHLIQICWINWDKSTFWRSNKTQMSTKFSEFAILLHLNWIQKVVHAIDYSFQILRKHNSTFLLWNIFRFPFATFASYSSPFLMVGIQAKNCIQTNNLICWIWNILRNSCEGLVWTCGEKARNWFLYLRFIWK